MKHKSANRMLNEEKHDIWKVLYIDLETSDLMTYGIHKVPEILEFGASTHDQCFF